jgi:hypothetical protein
MKSGLMWMALAITVLVSTGAWAVWDPDADASLVFNMNFEVYDNGLLTTDTAKPNSPPLKGWVTDYNVANPNVFGETSAPGLGFDVNLAAIHDLNTGAAINATIDQNTDCHVNVASYYPPIFNLGDTITPTQHTWTFWFNAPSIVDGTILRHASIKYPNTGFDTLMWEIRMYSGKMQFYHRNNSLRMETASTMSDLGLTVNTWHHAAIVIDRSNVVETSNPTTLLSSKIYIDGLEVPIIVSSVNLLSMDVDTDPYLPAPVWIGAGEREFDGSLDDIRLFSRVLTPVEVSILNQPDKTQPVALLPIPRSSEVVIGTGLSWVPSTSLPTAQKLYFGKDPCNFGDPCVTDNTGTLSSVTNGSLGGPFPLNTKYYWYIKSTIGGVDSNGPVWSFTTETGKAINPSPANNAEDINLVGVDLTWATPTAATYAVYLSKDRSLVEANSITVRVTDANSNAYVNDVDTNSRGTAYYWRVNSTYTSVGMVPGDIWSFRTKPYELVFNTSGVETTYADQVIPAYTCLAHKDGWSDPCATGSFASDGVVIFNFPSGFNYDKRYDIIVVPEYRATDICSPTFPNTFPTPLAIHVTGDFYFDGRVQIAGDDILTTSQDITFARSGGFPGPKKNQDVSTFNDRTVDPNDYWTAYLFNPADTGTQFHTRFGDNNSSTAHSFYEPKALAKTVFGPGVPVNPPYKGGGGGGAGGAGGEAARGYFFGVPSSGPSYGDKEVPVPFGGSGGGWGGGSSPGGAAGGGGIEIVTTGNVVLDVNSQIRADGGGQLCSSSSYPAGGGGGGSVRIIAGGSVTNKGIIDVNGGNGGKGGSVNNLGGGGGGGRVAIFYGGTYSNTGTITANGGAKGWYASSPPSSLAKNGQNGTIYVVNSSTVSPKKASAPTPANGNRTVYCNPDPCTGFQLKWYSGYGGTTDRVYCDTSTNPTTLRGTVDANRGQHSVTMTVSSGNTYYMKVITDGNVSSDTWSFSTVNWQCPIAAPGAYPHSAGLEWDTNHDCVIDILDFDSFADDWLIVDFGTNMINLPEFARLANEWRQCFNRTDGGCAGF